MELESSSANTFALRMYGELSRTLFVWCAAKEGV